MWFPVCWFPNTSNDLCSSQYRENLSRAVSFSPLIRFTRRTRHYILDGYVMCLREGCNKRVIRLDNSTHANARDGGITRGYGAFTAYQVISYPPKTSAPVY